MSTTEILTFTKSLSSLRKDIFIMKVEYIAERVRKSRDTVLWIVLLIAIIYLLILHVYYEDRSRHEINELESRAPPCSHVRKLQQETLKIITDHNTSDISLSEVQELRQKVAMYERLNKLLEFNSWMSQHGSKMRQNILIVSSQYCGSSLLGELFNQNPQVFYLYEPLRSLNYYKDNRPTDVYDAMVTHLLDGIFHCKFDELSYFANFMSFQYSSLKSRLASRALSAPPLCPPVNSRSFYSIRMCTPLKPQTTSAICKLHQHTVVKTVQFVDVHKLSYLMDKDSSDYSLKVVHLVRDPRAIVFTHFLSEDNSSTNSSDDLKSYSKNLCDQMLRNIKYAITAPPWLQGKYTLLRYEDLGTNPHQIAELVYKFVGVPVAPQVRMWLDKLAYGATTRSSQTGSSTSGSVEDFYSKNLTSSVHNWRVQMKYTAVRVIETECYEVMNLLGYKIVDDEEELTTLSFSLVD
ncbi:carbohydrate sulfotransferase 6-like [Hydractinia symbiolongicarpus]|uniref:carbohydrate sulfotransferase 6-like n=1 Tax=Hydractinia symbiolongicarpus TaxID=13093 RepID=UPI00254B0D14|nr:carbohydrate sulfotransferase 6-like [Hydractinia symbiolongicarpus]